MMTIDERHGSQRTDQRRRGSEAAASPGGRRVFRPRPIRRGFSLIELVVVTAIITLLLSLLIPAVQSARGAAQRADCRSRLRQFALALHSYHEAHLVLPPGSFVMGPSFPQMSGWGWGAMVLPQLEQSTIHRRIDFTRGTAVGPNRAVIRESIPFWKCPSDQFVETIDVRAPDGERFPVAAGNYLGVEPMLAEMSATRFGDVTDGLSSTLMLGEQIYRKSETNERTSSWIGTISFENAYSYRSTPHEQTTRHSPINSNFGITDPFSSRHPGGAFFAFGDGRVEFLGEEIDLDLYEALATIDGDETSNF